MSKPNKTVGNWRQKNPFPEREKTEQQKKESIEFDKRLDIVIEKRKNKEWTDEECSEFLRSGEIK